MLAVASLAILPLSSRLDREVFCWQLPWYLVASWSLSSCRPRHRVRKTYEDWRAWSWYSLFSAKTPVAALMLAVAALSTLFSPYVWEPRAICGWGCIMGMSHSDIRPRSDLVVFLIHHLLWHRDHSNLVLPKSSRHLPCSRRTSGRGERFAAENALWEYSTPMFVHALTW